MQLARKKHSDFFPPLPLTRSFRIQYFGGLISNMRQIGYGEMIVAYNSKEYMP